MTTLPTLRYFSWKKKEESSSLVVDNIVNKQIKMLSRISQYKELAKKLPRSTSVREMVGVM